jgi:hypothetical protein
MPLGLLVLILISGRTTVAAAPRADEHSVIAAFLLHFVQFTNWPDAAFSGTDTPMTVGVIGTDPFGSKLDDTFRGERAGDRPFVIKRLSPEAVPEGCHLLFVGELDDARLRRLLERLKGRPVLTVSTRSGFCEDGGMVAFEVERGKVVFAIRRDSVKEAGLSIHSRLLNMARVFRGGESH